MPILAILRIRVEHGAKGCREVPLFSTIFSQSKPGSLEFLLPFPTVPLGPKHKHTTKHLQTIPGARFLHDPTRSRARGSPCLLLPLPAEPTQGRGRSVPPLSTLSRSRPSHNYNSLLNSSYSISNPRKQPLNPYQNQIHNLPLFLFLSSPALLWAEFHARTCPRTPDHTASITTPLITLSSSPSRSDLPQPNHLRFLFSPDLDSLTTHSRTARTRRRLTELPPLLPLSPSSSLFLLFPCLRMKKWGGRGEVSVFSPFPNKRNQISSKIDPWPLDPIHLTVLLIPFI